MSAEPASGTAPAVEITGLTHRFGDQVAVDSLDLTVSPGECFGLLGPNGAGKTTTLRVLNTLYPPQSGTVRVFGRDPAADPAQEFVMGGGPPLGRPRERPERG